MFNLRLLRAVFVGLGIAAGPAFSPRSLAQTYRDSGGTVVPAIGQAGSNGKDYSANPPTPPNIGANFGATGPYANYVLIATVPASATRFLIDVENTSGAQVVIVRDDGVASGGVSPANASIFALGAGSGVGSQGGSWSSLTFKGRAQIYAPSSMAQVAVFVD
jgi:hypothetical protein